MTIAHLPLEIWESILNYCNHATQFQLRQTCRSWKRHVEKRIIPAHLTAHHYRVPDVNILLFNGFHQYRNNQALSFTGVQEEVYHPYRESVADYAVFTIVDPLRYFKLNRLEDVEDLHLVRDRHDACVDEDNGSEYIVISKYDLRKFGMIGADEQSVLIPYSLIWRNDWKLQEPVQMEPFVDGVAVSLYGMGTPNQTWSMTFSSGANLPY